MKTKCYVYFPDPNRLDADLQSELPGKEGFILENDHGLRWGPKELGFDDNRLSAGEYNGQNYCMLAKYGNKGKFSSKDFPSSRRSACAHAREFCAG